MTRLTLDEFRNNNPDLNYMNNDELITALHSEYAPNEDFKEFSKSMGYNQSKLVRGIKSFANMVEKTIPNTATGIGMYYQSAGSKAKNTQEDASFKFGKGLIDWAKGYKTITPEPSKAEQQTISGKIGSTFGSLASFIAVGPARILGQLGMMSGQYYLDIDEEKPEWSEKKKMEYAFQQGVVATAMEKAGVSYITAPFKGMGKQLVKGAIKDSSFYGLVKNAVGGFAKGYAVEGSEEGLQQLSQNGIDKAYSLDKGLMDGVVESVIYGGLAGGTVRGVGSISLDVSRRLKARGMSDAEIANMEKNLTGIVNNVIEQNPEKHKEAQDILKSGMESNAHGELVQALYQSSKDGYIKKYHQTSPENEQNILSEGFRFDARGSGANDPLPIGINTKSTDAQLAIQGKGAQMEIYITRTASVETFRTRDDAEKYFYYQSDVFKKAMDRHRAIDREYIKKNNELDNRINNIERTTEGRSQRDILSKEQDELIEEWEAKANEQLQIAQKESTAISKRNGWDAITIEQDRGSFGRITDNTIIINPDVIKTKQRLFEEAQAMVDDMDALDIDSVNEQYQASVSEPAPLSPIHQEALQYASADEFVKQVTTAEDRGVTRKTIGFNDMAEVVPVETLKENTNNPIDKSTVSYYKEEIQSGRRPALIVDENNNIIDGHHKFLAYKTLGINDIPVVKQSQLTDIWNEAQEAKNNEKEVQTKEVEAVDLNEVDSSGKTKVRGLAKGVEAKAIENKLTDSLGDLPEYSTINMADQANQAIKLLAENPELARKIAMGEEMPPSNLLPESVFIAVENQAIEQGDVATLRELATASSLTTEATIMGQRLRTLAERNEDSPVKAINDIAKARHDKATERLKGKSVKKAKAETISDINSEIKKASPTKETWQSFIQSIQC